MNYYNEIKDKLIKNEVVRKVNEYKTNKNDLTTYYEVGKLLSEAGKHYGEGIIKEYSNRLTKELGKGFTFTVLTRMKKYYNLFQIEKLAPSAQLLTWSHYIELLPIKDINEINYYIDISIKQNLSRNRLRDKIRNKEYERLSVETKEKLISDKELEISDFIKEPVILNKRKDYDKISELVLKEIILGDLDNFLKELGDGFCYIGNEFKIRIGNTYNYIDILLFNYLYNAFVVVELKVNELRKQDIGQIMIYMNYVNENIRKMGQDKTIGIIVCKENNKYLIKYSSDSRIHAVTYEIV